MQLLLKAEKDLYLLDYFNHLHAVGKIPSTRGTGSARSSYFSSTNSSCFLEMIIKILCYHRTLHYWNLELIRAIDLCVSTRQLVEAELSV